MVVKSANQVTFVFSPGGQIKNASLVGDFNGWDIFADPMQPMSDGSFRKTRKLPAGRYEYKFYADGIFWNDPEGESQAINPYGTLNSVITVTE